MVVTRSQSRRANELSPMGEPSAMSNRASSPVSSSFAYPPSVKLEKFEPSALSYDFYPSATARTSPRRSQSPFASQQLTSPHRSQSPFASQQFASPQRSQSPLVSQQLVSPNHYVNSLASSQLSDPYRFLTSGSSYPGRQIAMSSSSSSSSYPRSPMLSNCYNPPPFVPSSHQSSRMSSAQPNAPFVYDTHYQPEDYEQPTSKRTILGRAFNIFIAISALLLVWFGVSYYFPLAIVLFKLGVSLVLPQNPFFWPKHSRVCDLLFDALTASMPILKFIGLALYAILAACFAHALSVLTLLFSLAWSLICMCGTRLGLSIAALIAGGFLLRRCRKGKSTACYDQDDQEEELPVFLGSCTRSGHRYSPASSAGPCRRYRY